MNYIQLINQFWKLRRSKRITSKQADLYFFLIQECNEKNWENPFTCSNKLIIASIDMQEPTLIDARNRLKQLELIDFIAGKRNEASPSYMLSYLNYLSRNRDESIANSIAKPEMNDEHYKQTKQNKTVFKKINACEGDLSKIEIGNSIEFVDRVKQVKLSTEEILNYWAAFNLNESEPAYFSREKKIQHFRNWLKNQKNADKSINGSKVGISAKRMDALRNFINE